MRPPRDDQDDETRRDQRDEEDETTLPTRSWRSDGLLDLSWMTLGVILGPFWVEWPQHHPSNATFSTTPFSRHRGHHKSNKIGRFRVPKKSFFEDGFASCQASWSQRGRLEQLRKIMKLHWFLRYATRVGHFRNARNKSNDERNNGTKSWP